ncbi:MAG: DapH/DapD/GlmU-related protein, partial [bacterium]
KQRGIDLINTGVMCGQTEVFRKWLPECESDNESGEIYLTDVIRLVNNDGGTVRSIEHDNAWEVTGINRRRQLVEFEREGYERKIESLWNTGVTIHDPDRVKIGPWVNVESDVELEGDVTIRGESRIGSGTIIEGNTIIENSYIGTNNTIVQSHIRDASTGDEVQIGPYSHVRPGTAVEDDVRLGNFVEIKKSTIQSHTNVAHLSYVGDAEIGEDVNVGAGTITCNYDGKEKHKTTIESDVFIGSNTELVAPVTVGEGALIGAGSTVTRDVPPRSLALSRVDQENREGWVNDFWEDS